MVKGAPFKVAFLTQQLPDDATHPPGHYQDSSVGFFAAGSLLLVKSPKSGEQPMATQLASINAQRSHLLQKGKEMAVSHFAAAGARGGHDPRISTKLFGPWGSARFDQISQAMTAARVVPIPVTLSNWR